MKSRIMLTLLAVSLVLIVCACSTEIKEDPGPQAKLLSLTITTQAGRNIAVSAIPDPIPRDDWDDEEYEVVAADFGTIPVVDTSETDGVSIKAAVSPGAVVRWGKARAGNRPDKFDDPRVTAEFTIDDFLYFKVTADDGETINYYRFYSIIASPVKELAGIAIAGRDPDKLPTPAASMETLAAEIGVNANFRGQIDITRGEATIGALVAATPQDATANVRYAIAANAAAAQTGNFGDFTATDVVVVQDEQKKDIPQAHDTLTFTDGNILAVEVTAQNGSDVNYYGFMVTAGRMATIANLKLDGVGVTGKGTQHAQWGSVTPGSYASADQTAAGFAIDIELDDPDGSYDYAVINNINAAAPSAYGTGGRILFSNNQALAIRVRSARESNADTRYYKVQINLLAGNFTEHPKSDYYYYYNADTKIDDTLDWYAYVRLTVDPNHANFASKGQSAVQPLGFKLDREGSFTYQWYESNSWYGGYGFDADGRILYYKTGETTPTRETGFTADSYHQDHFDEKRNVSLHNGGNEFYNLPYPGRPIPGANGPAYTPPIDKRPFIADFTSESHYYWVEITDSSGLKVTSKRATIISERNPTKDHYIVDLYAYLDKTGATPGLQDNPRNATPFKAGNHGDQYHIPMTFPAGFDIMDYSVVTCQALFYLADGRAWIQNWTQGDFGFAKAPAEGSGDPERLVLWYNLTNDNATRGLSGSGNEPSGSGLEENPTHLLIQPAGTSPIKQMPPFRPDGQPDKEAIEADGKTAQGWFTPYIEVVELRFEGPSRR